MELWHNRTFPTKVSKGRILNKPYVGFIIKMAERVEGNPKIKGKLTCICIYIWIFLIAMKEWNEFYEKEIRSLVILKQETPLKTLEIMKQVVEGKIMYLFLYNMNYVWN